MVTCMRWIRLSLCFGLVVTCLGQSEKNVVWTFETKGKIFSHPVVEKGYLLFGSDDGSVYCLDTKSGKKRWSYETRGAIRSEPVVVKDKVFVKSGNDVFALKVSNGELAWRAFDGSEMVKKPIDPWDYHSGSAGVWNNTVIFGFENGTVQGFDGGSGQVTFQFQSEKSAPVKSGLLVKGNRLYFGDWNGIVYGYDLAKKKLVWSQATYEEKPYGTFGSIVGGFATHGENLYMGLRNPEMPVLNRETGAFTWRFKEKGGGWISGDPLVYEGILYVGGSDNHDMSAFDPVTGERKWAFRFLNNCFSKPLVVGDNLIFTTGDAYNVYGSHVGYGYLYAINRHTGKLVNFEYFGGNTYTSPVLSSGLIFLGNEDGRMLAIDLERFLNSAANLKEKGYNSVQLKAVEPKPFVDEVTFSYSVAHPSKLNMVITDLSDETVATLVSGSVETGDHSVKWDGQNSSGEVVADGYYFIKMTSGISVFKQLVQKKANQESK